MQKSPFWCQNLLLAAKPGSHLTQIMTSSLTHHIHSAQAKTLYCQKWNPCAEETRAARESQTRVPECSAHVTPEPCESQIRTRVFQTCEPEYWNPCAEEARANKCIPHPRHVFLGVQHMSNVNHACLKHVFCTQPIPASLNRKHLHHGDVDPQNLDKKYLSKKKKMCIHGTLLWQRQPGATFGALFGNIFSWCPLMRGGCLRQWKNMNKVLNLYFWHTRKKNTCYGKNTWLGARSDEFATACVVLNFCQASSEKAQETKKKTKKNTKIKVAVWCDIFTWKRTPLETKFKEKYCSQKSSCESVFCVCFSTQTWVSI